MSLITCLFTPPPFLQVISAGGVTYKNDPYHRDCFTCSNCKKSLAGERFTSKEEKPYCANCFGELFAKKCFQCTKPITGTYYCRCMNRVKKMRKKGC